MTIEEVKEYFQYHNANMRLIKIGFDEVRKQIKILFKNRNGVGDYIYLLQNDNSEKITLRKVETSLSRILAGVQVSWAEESIKRLLYENDVFTDVQRTLLIRIPALDQKWLKCFHVVFCIAYDLVPVDDPGCEMVDIKRQRRNLGNELVNQYFQLKGIITGYLTPNFSIRNKVQHGEWEFAFKPPFSEEYSQSITDKVQHENIITTTSRFVLVNALYQMIVDLARFKSDAFAIDSIQTPFEYFYRDNIRKILFETHKIRVPNLDVYITEMLQREIRGEAYRLANQAANDR